MKDFLGKDLAVGDTVVFIAPRYRILCKGEIFAFTPLKARVKYLNTWNYRDGYPCELLQEPKQLVKV